MEIALPIGGDLGDIAYLGEVVEFGLSEKVGIDLQIGYITMFLKDESVIDLNEVVDNCSMIPIHVGFSYYSKGSEAGGPYGKMMMGFNVSSITSKYDFGYGFDERETDFKIGFSIAPAFGYRIGPIDLALRTNIIINKIGIIWYDYGTQNDVVTYLGFRAAYVIGGNN